MSNIYIKPSAIKDDSHKHSVSTITDFTTQVESLINSKLAANDAMLFKGTIGEDSMVTELPEVHEVGWTYKVATPGVYAGEQCEIGDLILCIASGEVANDADWTIVQTNNDGCVSGPASALSGNFAMFDGESGKLITDSTYSPMSFANKVHTHDCGTW